MQIDPRLFLPDAIDAPARAAGTSHLPPPLMLAHAETRAIRGPADGAPLRTFRNNSAPGAAALRRSESFLADAFSGEPK